MKLLSPKIFINGNKTSVMRTTENFLTVTFYTVFLLFLFAPTEQGCLNPLVYTELTIKLYAYKYNECIPSNVKRLFANIITPHIVG